MIDPILETKLRLLALQIESWKKLHDFITYALDKGKPIISADQESQFTEVRGILLQESEYVFDELGLIAELSGKAMNVLAAGGLAARRARSLGRGCAPHGSRLEFRLYRLGITQGQLKTRRKELLESRASLRIPTPAFRPQKRPRLDEGCSNRFGGRSVSACALRCLRAGKFFCNSSGQT